VNSIEGAGMQKFDILTGIAAPLPVVNCDTDKIIPARFLKAIKKTGLGKNLFDAMRYKADGSENPDFVLNNEPYRKASILIAAENFGCGSSREHAPWALVDFGIRCIIAPSYADIFYTNCFKNGMLPITLPEALVEQLMKDAELGANATFTVDLVKQQIVRPNGEIVSFDLDPFRKHCLLGGLDDIGLTLEEAPRIEKFEGEQALSQPWLHAV
jgi:3-isopropylmalate/(R)-2-methylmalate dehydratase small subunit